VGEEEPIKSRQSPWVRAFYKTEKKFFKMKRHHQSHRDHIDDICLGDKFEHNGMTYTVKSFHGSTRVFVEGTSEEGDHYTFRDEKLRQAINEFLTDPE